MSGRRPPEADLELRDVAPAQLAAILRAVLGLASHEATPSELAVTLDRELPELVETLDAGGWIGWCMIGLRMFSGPLPTLVRTRAEATRVIIAAGMYRTHGSISWLSELLGTSRKQLRDSLLAHDLYPWDRVVGERLRGRSDDADGI